MGALLINCLCVGAGGFLGSVFRYLLGFLNPSNQSGFPFITLLINVVGAFAIALIAAYFASNLNASSRLHIFLQVGLCGGFTTFSAFSLESYTLIKNGDLFTAGLYIVLSVVLCLVAVFLGYLLARKVFVL